MGLAGYCKPRLMLKHARTHAATAYVCIPCLHIPCLRTHCVGALSGADDEATLFAAGADIVVDVVTDVVA